VGEFIEKMATEGVREEAMKLGLWNPEWAEFGLEKPDCFVCQREGKREEEGMVFCPLMKAWLDEALVKLIHCNACMKS